MKQRTTDLEDCVALLRHARSPKRRSAARRLGKSGVRAYGAPILAALKREVRDVRTWETQCAMIRALGNLNYRRALPFLWRLTGIPHPATMIYHELGFTIARLHPITNGDLVPVRRMIDSGNVMLTCGGFAAMYFLRIIPVRLVDIRLCLAAARRDVEYEGMLITKRWYIAAAAAKWRGPEARHFLKWCQKSDWPYLREIATSSLAGEYSRWRPW